MSKIGAHVSAAGGVAHAPLNAQQEQLETFQFFSRPPQTFSCPPLPASEIIQFLANVKQSRFKSYYIHAPYLVNLASANLRIRHASITLLRQELERGTQLQVQGVIFHVGSAASQPSRAAGVSTAIKSLNQILEGYHGSCKLVLENAAGSGQVLGCTFEELARLLKGITHCQQKVAFCLDTQHAFASGYDLRSRISLNQMIGMIDNTIGLTKLLVVQVNDSKTEFNSKVDRHEHIGKGKLGKTAFAALLNHPKLKSLDFILETASDQRAADVKLLKQLRKL